MNTYAKFAPTVFVAKCKDPHQKGEIITLTSKNTRVSVPCVFVQGYL